MDIIKSRPVGTGVQKKWWVAGLLGCTGVSLLFWALAGSNQHPLVAKSSLLLDAVQRGSFAVNIRGTGHLVSSDIRWISNPVEGKVERILVKAGAAVKQGDLLMELANPQLEQALLELRWHLQEQEAQVKAQLAQFASDLLDKEALVLTHQLDYEKAQLRLKALQSLREQGLSSVSGLEFQEAEILAQQLKKRWQVELQRLDKTRENLAAQQEAANARLEKERRIVARAEQNVQDLQVRASLDSIVQEMPMEIGQQVLTGTNLAKLARQGQYIAEIRIAEKQMRDVAIGQPVVVDTRNSKINGTVLRIDPAVSEGTVQVDVAFQGAMPKEARPDLTVEAEIAVTRLDDALYVRRPVFAQDDAEAQVYKVVGNNAVRVPVRFGRMSSQHIQIVEGLVAGDQIIVSDANAWQDHPQIQLN
jgi:multidrug efflux pump subunit AcrA (membrane-fusion protein)